MSRDECQKCGGQLIVSGTGRWSRTVCDGCGDEQKNIIKPYADQRDREEGDELFDWAIGNGWE